MSGRKRQLTCSCCGSDAGRWEQFHNQDTGFGMCGRCREDILSGKLGRGMDPAEFRRTYGKPGVHYEAKKVQHFGRLFTVLAEFPRDKDDAANAYMLQYPGAAVLGEWDGKTVLADSDDMGEPIAKGVA